MNTENGRLPDFLVIGTQKAGTGSIHAVLSQHHRICMPRRTGVLKELHFFTRDQNYERGLDYYRSFFAHCSPDTIIGEVTPNYVFDTEAARRIHKDLPEARLIACLREPISRAVSQYRMEVLKDGLIGRLEDLVQVRDEYLGRGRYAEQLDRFDAYRRAGRLHVCFYEDMIADAEGFYHSIFEFLGAGQFAGIDVNQRVFSGGAPRSQAVTQGLRVAEKMYRPFRRAAGDSRLGEYLTRAAQKIKNEVIRANRVDAPPPALDEAFRRRLEAYFRPHNERLLGWTGRLPQSWQYEAVAG